MRQPKILVFAGSARTGSFNAKLAALAAKRLAILDANVTTISLRDYPLPVYDGDYEDKEGVPANAVKLKKLFKEHDGIFIACPEYNSGITPLLKNTLDWISRHKEPGEDLYVAFRKPVFALGAATTGSLAGMRGLINVRTVMEIGLGAMVLPQMVTVSKAQNAFDDKGELTDELPSKQLDTVAKALIRATKFEMSH